MTERCVCGHDQSFHDEPPGSVCVAGDGCRCAKYIGCHHPEHDVQRRLDGAIDLVCTQCGAIEVDA